MKLTPKEIITTLIAWTIVQAVILSVSLILWNLVMPSLNVAPINFLQITLIYVLYKVFTFDWIAQYNKEIDAKQSQNGEAQKNKINHAS